jgi:iron complex outermembrane receptor protein
MLSKKLTLGCGVAAAALTLARAAAAAEAASEGAALEEIVVTAQRRAERLEDVPISITAVTGQTLKDSGIINLEDLTKIAPGVDMGRTGVIPQPAIRGVTSFQVTAGAENNIAVYVDNLYRPVTRSLYFDLVNISQVTILKGPQGTLFGRNATGGALLVETLAPSLTTRSGKFGASYGRFNDRRGYGYVSTPLGDKMAFNLAGNIRKSDGYIRDVRGFDTGAIYNYNLYAKLLIQPTDALRVTLGLDTTKTSNGQGLAITAEGRVLGPVLFPGTYVETRDNRTSLSHPTIADTRNSGVTAKIEYDLPGAKITSLTRWEHEHDFTHYDIDLTSRLLFDQYLTNKDTDYSQEVNLTSTGSGKLNYVVGAYYFHWTADTEGSFSQVYPSTAYVPQTTTHAKAKAYAVYADVTWQALDKLFLTGGVRYSHERKSMRVTAASGAILADKQEPFDSVTPRAVIRYQITPDSNVYGSYSRGFKSGAINSGAPYNTVRPEKLGAFEVGYKYAGSRLRFDAAAYHYNYTDLQVTSLALINNVNQAVTTNAASAKIYGAEVQLTAAVTDQLNLRASGAYNHARYKKFLATVNLPNPTTGLNSGTCANPTPPPATTFCVQDQSGQPLVRAPDWTFNLGGDYTAPLPGGSDLIFTANIAYSSSLAPSKSDLGLNGTGLRYGQGAYTLVNLSAAWRAPGERLKLTVYGNNVFDTRYFVYRTGNAYGDYHILGEPATWGVRADYNF